MTKIDETFLTWQEDRARDTIEGHTPSETFPGIGPDVIIGAYEVVGWVGYTRHLKDVSLNLLAEQQKLKKALKQTQYLSTIWIKMLSEYIPEGKKAEAFKKAAIAIAKGMKEAGIEEYNGYKEQLEKQIDGQ